LCKHFIYDRIKEEEDADADGILDGRDTDMDGLIDGYEMGYTDWDGNAYKEAIIGYINLGAPSTTSVRIASTSNLSSNSSYSSYYLDYISNPNSTDSDRDGYIDNIDADPRDSYIKPIFLPHGVWSNVKNVFGAYNDFADDKGNIKNDNEDSTHE
jgi:hypothetical protein